MRDPLSWSIPLFRAFGIQVRLHILYIIITLGMILRVVAKSPEFWVEYTLVWVLMLFVIVLLHEFGHCFAARREGGEANDILMWPLGGLATCDVPHSPRAHFNTAAGGPFVNVIICLACAAILIPFGKVLPPLNPLSFDQLYRPKLHNWTDGSTRYSPEARVYYKEGSAEIVDEYTQTFVFKDGPTYVALEGKKEPIRVTPAVTKTYESWVLWTARLFWMSWFLFLFNLIPAFPLDGGRLLQSFVWGRTGDYRRGTMIAIYTGFAVSLAFILVSFWIIDPLLLGMAIFIWVFCRQQYMALEMAENESLFGYDFSQGYTSLEKDEPVPPKPKKQGFFSRWRQARRERKALLDAEQRVADEVRMDELLDKIHRQGKEALSDEERRFMDRVSARYRNRS
ncbi:MAG: site-2 protease family protein [Planctomycetes bacterium]|nr:site-2 protease family protein [Planctomycetota bacterium]